MLQDVMRGRRTEIDYLNGFVVDQGKATGVATPFNEAVVRLFHERGTRFAPDPRNLAPLLQLLP
jgi:2-dehydropantoate 2-reductase